MHRLIKRMKNTYYANIKHKTASMPAPISDKLDLKARSITIEKEGHFIMTRGKKLYINMYAFNRRISKYFKPKKNKKTKLKGK